MYYSNDSTPTPWLGAGSLLYPEFDMGTAPGSLFIATVVQEGVKEEKGWDGSWRTKLSDSYVNKTIGRKGCHLDREEVQTIYPSRTLKGNRSQLHVVAQEMFPETNKHYLIDRTVAGTSNFQTNSNGSTRQNPMNGLKGFIDESSDGTPVRRLVTLKRGRTKENCINRNG